MRGHFSRASGGIRVEYITRLLNTTSSPVYTFNATPIGGPGLIIVGTATESAGGYQQVSSVSVGGFTATQVAQAIGTNINGSTTASLWRRVVTAGTTAQIVVNFSGSPYSTPARLAVVVWRIRNYTNATPNATDADTATSGSSLTSTLSSGVDSHRTNAVVSMFAVGTHNLTASWNNGLVANVNEDISAGSSTRVAAASGYVTVANSTSIVATLSSSSSQTISLATASFY